MKKFLRINNVGKILSVNVCVNDDFEKQLGYPNFLIEIDINDDINIFEWYVLDNNLIKLPTKPEGSAYFDYNTKQWVLDYNSQEVIVKQQRDRLLYESDWTQIPNNPLTTEQQEQWAIYRQQLRDITSQSGYPFNVVWPIKP